VSSVDLIILGIIRNQSMSAYDLAELSGVYELIKVSKPAIYKNIRTLEKKGYLQGETHKAGNMPEKRMYSITETGRQRIKDLAVKSVQKPLSFHYDFNVFIFLIEQMPYEFAIDILGHLTQSIEINLEYLKSQREQHSGLSFPIDSLVRQHIMLNETLASWLDEFVTDYISKFNPDKMT